MGNCRTGLAAKPLIFLLILLAMGGFLPPHNFGANGLSWIGLSIRSFEGEVYTLVPGCEYEIVVTSNDSSVKQLELSLTGPEADGLTGSFAILWNETGFFDLGDSKQGRCLLGEHCTTSGNQWFFSVVLPNQTMAGTWEARIRSGDLSAVKGFQVATVYWNSTLLSQTHFTNVKPGETSTSTARVGVSCNGDLRIKLGCSGISGPDSEPIIAKILMDDDPFFEESNESGADPQLLGNESIVGPTIEAGIGRELEMFLFLKVPIPLICGCINGKIVYEFEAVDGTISFIIELYISLLRGLAQSFRPVEPVSIEYAADLDTASHKSGMVFPIDIKLKQLGVLEEAGVQTIRITPAYDIFLHQDEGKIADLDMLTSRIRADGKKIMIADGAAEEYWSKPMDWQNFSQAFIDRVGVIAARYQPDYYVVVKEPIWYMGMNWSNPGGMLTENVTVGQWISLTVQLCDEVKRESPATQTGISISLPYNESKSYLLMADLLDNIDFVGIDIYNIAHLEHLEECVDYVTKPKWILETWDGNPDAQENQTWRTASAAEWIRMMAYYAQSRGFDGLATFFNLYLCYDYSEKPQSFDQVRSRLDDRQESFYSLQLVIQNRS